MSQPSYRRESSDEVRLAHFREQLVRLAKLERGSDNWSPHRPSATALKTAQRIGEDTGRDHLFVSVVAATSEGGIQLKWQGAHRQFSLVLYPDQTMEYLFLD